MDPRVKTPREGLAEQFRLSKEMYDGTVRAYAALDRLRGVREQIKAIQNPPRAVAAVLAEFDKAAAALEGEPGGGFGGPPAAAAQAESLNSVAFSLRSVMSLLQGGGRRADHAGRRRRGRSRQGPRRSYVPVGRAAR